MAGKIGDLLLRPDAFFRRLVEEPENLKIPALIVIGGAIIYAVSTYFTSGLTMKIFDNVPEMASMAPILGIFGAIFAFFTFIILFWLIFSGAFYLISMAFSGSGEFKRTLQCSGYGLIPVIIGSLISLLISLYYIPMIQVPVLTNIQDPAAIEAAIQQLMQDTAFSELRLITSIISIIFLIWSANLWIFGLKHARNLPLKQAAIAVFIPVVVYIIFILYMAVAGIPGMGGT